MDGTQMCVIVGERGRFERGQHCISDVLSDVSGSVFHSSFLVVNEVGAEGYVQAVATELCSNGKWQHFRPRVITWLMISVVGLLSWCVTSLHPTTDHSNMHHDSTSLRSIFSSCFPHTGHCCVHLVKYQPSTPLFSSEIFLCSSRKCRTAL